MTLIKKNFVWIVWAYPILQGSLVALTSILVLSCAPKPAYSQTTETQGENFSVIAYNPYAVNTVGLHLGTLHFQGTWNDINPGGYAKLNNGITLGTYYNSERKQSYYVGRTFSKNLTQNLEIAATVGIISGYNQGVLPLVLPTVAYKFHQDFAARVGFVPKVNKRGSAGLHFMLEKQF